MFRRLLLVLGWLASHSSNRRLWRAAATLATTILGSAGLQGGDAVVNGDLALHVRGGPAPWGSLEDLVGGRPSTHSRAKMATETNVAGMIFLFRRLWLV